MGIMERSDFADISNLEAGFDAAVRDARALVADLAEAVGEWKADADSWSVAECLDHLATANEVYLNAMRPVAERALARGRRRRGPAIPGFVGRWFVKTLEPPVKPGFKMRAPRKIRPRSAPALDAAAVRFFASHTEVRAFLGRYADVDLTGVRFPNPFIPGVRFSLATGLHVIAAHERRHLWQAWRVRRAAEALGSAGRPASPTISSATSKFAPIHRR
jgi:DinB superfamily